jgi:hypothetical protein
MLDFKRDKALRKLSCKFELELGFRNGFLFISLLEYLHDKISHEKTKV